MASGKCSSAPAMISGRTAKSTAISAPSLRRRRSVHNSAVGGGYRHCRHDGQRLAVGELAHQRVAFRLLERVEILLDALDPRLGAQLYRHVGQEPLGRNRRRGRARLCALPPAPARVPPPKSFARRRATPLHRARPGRGAPRPLPAPAPPPPAAPPRARRQSRRVGPRRPPAASGLAGRPPWPRHTAVRSRPCGRRSCAAPADTESGAAARPGWRS